jgi:O-acetyl-ADP-ribose deacetylase (regulator of RNase III)
MDTVLDIGGARVVIKQGDITTEDTDAIVNAANGTLLGGGGVDGAIHFAGGPAILAECREIVSRIGRCDTGQAVITTGGNLPARHVIHTVGPIWSGGESGEPAHLARAYRNSLRLASEHSLESISYPSISTGAYRYPIAFACEIALRTVIDELEWNRLSEVRFVLFTESDLAVYERTARRLVDGA